MPDVAKLLRMGDDITGIRLNFANMYAAPRVVRDAAVALGGSYLVEDWDYAAREFLSLHRNYQADLFIMLSAVVAVCRIQYRVHHGDGG